MLTSISIQVHHLVTDFDVKQTPYPYPGLTEAHVSSDTNHLDAHSLTNMMQTA